jgi:NitT/TauT family transport system substrate-binding protein
MRPFLTLAFAATLLAATQAAAQTKLAIGGTPNPEPVTAMVAVEQGMFAKHDLDASYTLITINPSIPPALISNSLQVGIPTPTTFLQAIDGGLDLVIIGGVSDTSRKSSRIHVVARKDSGIKEPKDLVGKKIAVPGLNAVIHVMTRYLLAQKGIDPKSVNFVEAVFPQHGDMLRSGQIEAVATADPFLANILTRGDGMSVIDVTEEFPEGMPTQMYVTTRDFAAKNAAAVASFRAGIEEAKAFIAANPDKAREAIGKTLKLPPPVTAALAIPAVDTKVTAAQMAFWVDIMQKQNMLSRPLDPAKVIVE